MNGGSGKRKLFHPTQKPLALFEFVIKSYTDPGAVVLDNCIGSGTTALACIASDRHYIGIEQSPDYAAMAISRIAELEATVPWVA
jgi:site-specific DNA-methyltransferase (adenine-specific)